MPITQCGPWFDLCTGKTGKQGVREEVSHKYWYVAGSEGDEVLHGSSGSPCAEAQAPTADLSTPAHVAAAPPQAMSPAVAAYERSITRAQKIQMESLQRQLKVQRCPALTMRPNRLAP